MEQKTAVVNFRNTKGELLSTAISAKSVSDGIKKAARLAHLKTEKQTEKIKGVTVDVVINFKE